MNTQGFFGRVWQDSRRSMPSLSVGPLSAAPTLPVFTEGARASTEAKAAAAVPQTTTRAQPGRHSADSHNAVNRQAGKSPTAVAKADDQSTTVAFESLRFEPVSNTSWSTRAGSQTSSPLASPNSSLVLDSKKSPHTSNPDRAEPTATQTREWPVRAMASEASPPTSSAVAESTRPGQSKDAHKVSDAGEKTAPNRAVENSGFNAAESYSNQKTAEATPAVPSANLHKKSGAPSPTQPGADPAQPPGLHIGEVRIRLVEAPKEASPHRSSLTLTESDSRRLLRSL